MNVMAKVPDKMCSSELNERKTSAGELIWVIVQNQKNNLDFNIIINND